jgi:serine/threonine protein kinase
MRSNINLKFQEYKDSLLNIETLFNSSSDIVYNKRNIIKNIKIDDIIWSVKSFSPPKHINKIIYTFFRKSKAKRSFEYSLKISRFVPEPLGFIEFYDRGLISNSYFISKNFDYDFTIRDILFDDLDDKKIEILQEFAKFTFSLHQEGIEHLDYSPGNILIKRDNDSYIFKIVDINRMKFHRSLDLQQRAINFARVWLRDEDMEVIVYEYAKIASYNYKEMLKFALYHSQQHKYKANFKKRLKERLRDVRNK